MPARHYGQFLDSSFGQSADDSFTLATTPPEILRGSFQLYYIPREDSSCGSARYLLSFRTIFDHVAFVVEPAETDSKVSVYVNGDLHATLGPITFSAGQELGILFAGPAGTITVTGATTGNGTSEDGVPWNVLGAGMRLGGNVLGGSMARGYVSLPYAVPGALLPDPILLPPGQLDFTEPHNSGFLSIL